MIRELAVGQYFTVTDDSVYCYEEQDLALQADLGFTVMM